MRRGIERLRCVESFLFLTVTGIFYLATTKTPSHYAWVNGAAMFTAISAILFIRPIRTESVRYALSGIALTLLGLTIAIGPDVEGIKRWLQIGPVNLHIGMLVLPMLCVLIPRIDERIGAASVALAALLLALQSDAGTGMAWMLVSIQLSIQSPSRWLFGAAWAACAILTYTGIQAMMGAEILPVVPFVEGVFADLFWTDLLIFIPAACFALWLFLALGALAKDTAEVRTLQVFVFGLFLASFSGQYPTPFMGYGAAPILGYGLAIGLMDLKRRGGGQ